MSNCEIKKLFNSMEGSWEITRTFASTAAEFDAPKANGFAVFKRIDQLSDILIYFEKINLVWQNGNVNKCHQSYLYEFKNGVISKYQPNKKLDVTAETINEHTKMFELVFCPVDKLNPINAEGIFQCNKDSYAAEFKFKDSNKFSINYSVLGPYKKYETYSEYNKVLGNHVLEEELK